MTDTTFIHNSTVIQAAWLNEVNALAHKVFGNSASGLTAQMFDVASGDIKFLTGGVERLRIASDGIISTSVAGLQVGALGTGNRDAYIDLVGDSTYTDYGLRLIRNNTGENTSSALIHRGTGTLSLETTEAGDISLKTTGVERLGITAAGAATFTGSATVTGATTLSSTLAVTGVATFSADVITPSQNGGPLAGLRNRIINGNMNIAQRGTSFAAVASGVYTLDQWVPQFASTAVITVTQNADVPSVTEFQNSLRMEVTTADTAIAATDRTTLEQRIEGFNVRDLVGKTCTISFWVRSAKVGVHCVSFRNNAGTRSYIMEYSIVTANTWEKKTITVTSGLIDTPTADWNWTNGIGLHIAFTLMTGTDFHTTAGAWQTGNFLGTVNQVNCVDTVGNLFAVTGVQLEVGTVATPFEARPYGVELALCQRYYAKGYAYARFTAAAAGHVLTTPVYFPVDMRASPTLTIADAVDKANTDALQLSQLTANTSAAGLRMAATAAGDSYQLGAPYTATAAL